MSNFQQLPTAQDSCMVCLEDYGDLKNIFKPKTCVHPICAKCAKRCTKCPYCNQIYKVKKEYTTVQRQIKHIYHTRKTMVNFAKTVRITDNQFGAEFDIHYSFLYQNYIQTIVLMETELQRNMNARDRANRRNKLSSHPYTTVELYSELVLRSLVEIPPVDEEA